MEKNKRSLTFRMLYYWGKFVGLNPLNLSENNEVEFSYFSLFYGFFLGTIYSYIFYRVFNDRLKSSMPDETPVAVIAFFIWISSQFFETLLTWLVFAFYQNRINFIVTSFFKAEKIARKLGISQDYEKLFRQLGVYVAVTNILYIATLTLTLMEVSQYSNFHTVLWIAYDIPRIISFNMEVFFAWSLDVVREKFHGLNEKLRFLMATDCRKENKADKKQRSGLLRNSSYRLSDRITMISKLHRQLRDIVYLIERHFAVLILFGIATHFTHISLNVYLIYRYAKVHHPIVGKDLIFMTPHGCWLLVSTAVLVVISNVCGSTSNKANETGNILHAMLNTCKKVMKSEETAKFNLLSLDLLKNRLSMSLFGFFELNYFFVFSAITSATTYLVIMLQFYS